jgi:hypothetical protein
MSTCKNAYIHTEPDKVRPRSMISILRSVFDSIRHYLLNNTNNNNNSKNKNKKYHSPGQAATLSHREQLRNSGLFASLRIEPLSMKDLYQVFDMLKLPKQKPISISDVLRICCVFGQVRCCFLCHLFLYHFTFDFK